MWPPRYLLRTIEALSIPLRQLGAGARAREAHGIQSNSHHVPSSRGARDLGESAFQLIFREGSRSGFPGKGKGLRRVYAGGGRVIIEHPKAHMTSFCTFSGWTAT